ncbi:7-cyano-7-deazaguanine/7-aminomethyl-7-deazaguanine transporter [Sphingobacterium sp. UT-1RO-CII-1]|uniref:7-cyano-7-deazaguanine/7-aminomethyl-7- deazaguanine transporter n=1 Tax=Sphingobacterium sp. UT-1RO-CII-1 TaxID=2995225 RepID=UPI00227A1DF9|nr:7-cyano-7-deazaguanine/7-aminomethyl-7-deazaguanine transporter [Sphingobacterium sp. UT-1RO-CII-1]MCY4779174.1 7-cyano-7-deazaguanine/7-aminomethyl-7-deazaguanine transporter [Sphingobacterium sp. UT-1RO-CII-1]
MLLHQKKSYYILTAFHIVIIAASNYLVQFPIEIYKFTTTWGAFTFPFIFLATDLTVRVFGAQLARKIIFKAMLPALLVSYFITVGFREGVWAGWSSFYTFSIFSIRIVLASFSAYVVGQIMDIYVFNKLRQAKYWWYAPIAAAIFGNLIDTYSFYYIAFYKGSDSFLAENVFELATVDYAFKMLISTLFFLPLYKVLLNRIIISIGPK